MCLLLEGEATAQICWVVGPRRCGALVKLRDQVLDYRLWTACYLSICTTNKKGTHGAELCITHLFTSFLCGRRV